MNNDGYTAGAYYTKIIDPNLDLNNYTLYKGFSRKHFMSSLLSLLKETKEYPIIHSHNVFDDAVYLWLLSVLKKKRIIITVHNDRAVTNYFKQPVISRLFLKLINKRSPTWIAVSYIAKQELLKLPIKFKDIKVFPAFIPPISKNNPLVPLSTELINFINGHDKIIVFYAYKLLINNEDIYGCQDALNMFSELMLQKPSHDGMIFCIADKEVDTLNLKLFAKENKIENKIYWQIGPILDMLVLWKHANVYIRPTLTDGDSIAVREAIGMGVNVVASNVAARPNNVLTYMHGNNADFVSKVRMAMNQKDNIQDEKKISDYQFYKKMLKIYINVLNSG